MLALVKTKTSVKEIFLMTVGVSIMAIGIYFFKIPNGFAIGGISGLATVLGHVQNYFTAGQIIPVLNILMLIVGFIFLGKETGAKTVYCSLLFSFVLWILERAIPVSAPLTNQPFLELIYGVMITSVASALLFDLGASSGGTDIAALILKKYTNIDVGKALLTVDFFIAASVFFVYNITTGLFTMLGLFIKAFLVDNVIESLNQCKSFSIVTEKPHEISDYILQTMKHSATCIDARGAYTNSKKTVIITLCKRYEAIRLKKFIREIDKDAFVIVNTTSEIIGRGFREL